jgi:hypothetical protein
MVHTSLVARLIEQAIADPQRFHVLITGDLDMIPAIRTIVADYTETVVLVTTHLTSTSVLRRSPRFG